MWNWERVFFCCSSARACVRLCFWCVSAFLCFWVREESLARRGRRRRRIRRWCWCWRWAICTCRTGRPICPPSSSPCWYPARSNTFLALVTYVSRCMSACLSSPLSSSVPILSDLLRFAMFTILYFHICSYFNGISLQIDFHFPCWIQLCLPGKLDCNSEVLQNDG